MKFCEVLNNLLNGQPVYREAWKNGRYIYYDVNKDLFIDDYPQDNFDVYTAMAPLRGIDLAADDWHINEWEGNK